MIDEIKSISGYEGMTDAAIADTVNSSRLADSANYAPSTFLNERTLFSVLGTVKAEAFLQTLQAVATAGSIPQRVVDWLKPANGGLDVGIAETQGQLAALSGTLDAADTLVVRNMGLVKKANVTAAQVQTTLAEDAVNTARQLLVDRLLDAHNAAALVIDADGDAAAVKAAFDTEWGV